MSLRPPRITARDLVDEPAPAAPATPAPGAVPAGVLSISLQERARRYVAARRRSGEALLEAVGELAAARAEAKHGEWGVFLEAIGLDETAAKVQLQIAERAAADSVFAERIRTGFLSLSTARELLSAPQDVQEQVLAQEEPPTRAEIREAKAAANGAPAHHLELTDGVVIELAPRAEALGLQLTKGLAGYVLQGPDLEPAIFMGRYGLEGYLSQREREASKKAAAAAPPAPAATADDPLDWKRDDLEAAGWKVIDIAVGPLTGTTAYTVQKPDGSTETFSGLYALTVALEKAPRAVLLKAGWRAHTTNPLSWIAPGEPDETGRLTELIFNDHYELFLAARVVEAEPDITGEALARRLESVEGRLVSAEEVETRERLALPPPADDPIPADVRVLASAYGLLTRPSPGGQFWLYWPGEEDEVGEGAEQLAPLDDITAREWLMWDAARLAKERAPQSLYCRALAAGYDIRGANSQTGQLLASVPGKDPDDFEAFAPADLEARLRQVAAEPAAPQPATSPAPEPLISVDDPELFEKARATSSIAEGYLDKGKIRRPFEYAGKLWICVGGLSGGSQNPRNEAHCVRVVENGTPWQPGQPHGWFREGAYTGQKAAHGGKTYVLTGQWLTVTRANPSYQPKQSTTPLSSAEQRTIELSAEQVAASRDNPAWAAGSDLAGDLAWDVIEALGAEGKDREITRALHRARQLVAALEREAEVEHDYHVPMVYRRLIDFEGTPGALGRVALQDLDDVLDTLEGLSGMLDDRAYEDLAARFGAVRSRKAAAA
jgi:hypothetical protein